MLIIVCAPDVAARADSADTGRGRDLLLRRLTNFEFCPHM